MGKISFISSLLFIDALGVRLVNAAGPTTNSSTISVDSTPPAGAGIPLEAFVSFSIEFSSFPDFAGNISHPNTFSNNLLNNIGNFTGTKPFIRVGGNTQDYAIFNSSLPVATVGIIQPNLSTDYPTILTFGPAYFESYTTWPDTRFSHGFNLGRNSTAARTALLDSVPYACEALGQDGRLNVWELGNEPDLYKTSAQGIIRPASWTEQDYVNEWLNLTGQIKETMAQNCSNLTTAEEYLYMAPSFAGTGNSLDPIRTWEDGLDNDRDIEYISSHNYIGGATQPGVTLQGTLMNHSMTVASVAHQLNESRLLAGLNESAGIPFILGETNSLYNEGAPGLSNSFGAALWGVENDSSRPADFNLYCAANNIRRVHMHQGTNYRYVSWQPIETNVSSIGTKAPYYGNIAVAAFLGNVSGNTANSTAQNTSIANLPLPNPMEAAYAAYSNSVLQRVMVINLQQYNYSNASTEGPRPMTTYNFQVPESCSGGNATVSRLMANGSDAITGITWNGYSYNYELQNGAPVLLNNVTVGESVLVGANGDLSVNVPHSSAAMVSLKC
ncbi:MAG: hypothetical protein M1821_001070 [Bathelium mastoideum]|nr:MAG: hypothetical protein M1821_001070 [Bathelium mastoideum]